MDFDIVKQIGMIEKLKCSILSETADLFQAMSEIGSFGVSTERERRNTLAKLMINIYLLSAYTGVDFETLDETVILRLKTDLLAEKNENESEYLLQKMLLRHFIRD